MLRERRYRRRSLIVVSGSTVTPMSSTPPGSDNFSLDTGLAALKQGDTETAIAQFEGICRTSSRQKDRLRAQMGLVTAYRRRGDTARSLQLCQQLCQAESQKVRQWAERQLKIKNEKLKIGGQGDKGRGRVKSRTSNLRQGDKETRGQGDKERGRVKPRTTHRAGRGKRCGRRIWRVWGGSRLSA